MFIFPHVILNGKNSWDVSIQCLMPRSCKLGSMESSGCLPSPGYDKLWKSEPPREIMKDFFSDVLDYQNFSGG